MFDRIVPNRIREYDAGFRSHATDRDVTYDIHSPDYSWPHTSPKHKRGTANKLPSLALRASMTYKGTPFASH